MTATSTEALRATAPGRDWRLDFFRGLALLFIFIDHVPGNWLGDFTLRNIGFSDAAELFVFVAGYAAALAYGRAYAEQGFWSGTRRVFARVRTLYIWHVGLVLLCAGLFLDAVWRFGNPLLFEHSNFLPFVSNEWQALGRLLTLEYQPGYLNILPLYMVLLALFPAIFWLIRRDRWLALGLSTALWLAADQFKINLPQFPNGGWFLNPFAWQVLFAVGAVAGHGAATGRPLLPRSPWLIGLAAAYALFALAQVAPWEKYGLDWRLLAPDALGLVNKSYMSPFRLFHILALAYLAAMLVPASAAWLKRRWARAIIACGRKSLDIFCLGTVLSFLGFFAFMEIGRGWETQLAVNLLGLGLLIGTALWLTRARKVAPKSAGTGPAAALRVSD